MEESLNEGNAQLLTSDEKLHSLQGWIMFAQAIVGNKITRIGGFSVPVTEDSIFQQQYVRSSPKLWLMSSGSK